MKIWKYKLNLEGIPTIIGDPVREILSVKNQNNEVYVWCVVDENYETTICPTFIAIGTGWELPEGFTDAWQFFDTVVTDPYVWHIYAGYSQEKQNVVVDSDSSNS